MKYKLIAKDGYPDSHEERINEFLDENPNIEIIEMRTWVIQGIGWNTSILYKIGETDGS